MRSDRLGGVAANSRNEDDDLRADRRVVVKIDNARKRLLCISTSAITMAAIVLFAGNAIVCEICEEEKSGPGRRLVGSKRAQADQCQIGGPGSSIRPDVL